MKKTLLIFSIFMVVAVACQPSLTAIPPTSVVPVTPAPTGIVSPVPTEISLNGVTLVVEAARLSGCDLVECPPAADGTRYLRVPLQALNLPADQFLDYKNLPEGIAIRDDTGVSTPYNRIYKYIPDTHELVLYFAVPDTAVEFSLQWPGAGEIPLTVVADVASTVLPPSVESVKVTVDTLSLVIPPQLASGVRSAQLPRADGQDIPAWERTPGHVEFTLDGYVLQGKLHEPQIFVYPAQAYAEMHPAAFESIHRLDNILYGPDPQIDPDQLPQIPFLNNQQVFASNIELIAFQNGGGVRFLTEYDQYPTSANNHELFYHFQGVSRDGQYYIAAILPITNPMLAETSDAGAPLPTGGVPYPYFAEGPNADMPLYYRSVLDVLNATPPEQFTPTIQQLDILIQSMRTSP